METRGIITIEGRSVVLPDAEVWMTAGELASLFYVRGVSVEAAIRKLKKDGIVDGGACRRIRLSDGRGYTDSRTAARSKKEPMVLFLHHPRGAYC